MLVAITPPRILETNIGDRSKNAIADQMRQMHHLFIDFLPHSSSPTSSILIIASF